MNTYPATFICCKSGERHFGTVHDRFALADWQEGVRLGGLFYRAKRRVSKVDGGSSLC